MSKKHEAAWVNPLRDRFQEDRYSKWKRRRRVGRRGGAVVRWCGGRVLEGGNSRFERDDGESFLVSAASTACEGGSGQIGRRGRTALRMGTQNQNFLWWKLETVCGGHGVYSRLRHDQAWAGSSLACINDGDGMACIWIDISTIAHARQLELTSSLLQMHCD